MSGLSHTEIKAFLDANNLKPSEPLTSLDIGHYYQLAQLHGVPIGVANFGLFNKAALPTAFLALIEDAQPEPQPEPEPDPDDQDTSIDDQTDGPGGDE